MPAMGLLEPVPVTSRARIIDQADGVVLQSRALGIHARALEVFE
jgi:hypothetical protein